jgi:hypothetical protein
VFKNQFKFSVTGILMFFVFSFGCTKIDTTSLGQNLIPAIDNIHTFDTTFQVIGINYDSTECDTIHRTSLQALGIIQNDPLFGSTSANIYVEFKPASYPYNFPVADANSIRIDSAVMVLDYSYSYGDTNQIQKVAIYQLSDSFNLSQKYTTCRVLDYDNSVLLGEKMFIPTRLKDSVHAYNENAANQLRIPLSASFAQKFIDDSAQIFRSDKDFVNYFKGFAVIADEATGGQGLNYFDVTQSRLSFYIRYKSGTTTDTTVINFGLSGYSGLSNSIVRNYGTSEITQHLSQPENGDSLLFIQTSPGTFALLHVPSITGLSNRVINRAEIILDQVYAPNALNDIFSPPLNLYLEVKDSSISSSQYIPIPCDFSSSEINNGFQYLGGQRTFTKDSSGNTIAEYRLNISRYLQAMVTKGKQNLTFRLSAPDYITNKSTYIDWCGQGIAPFSVLRNYSADGRVVLNGTNGTSTRARLHVVYSKL